MSERQRSWEINADQIRLALANNEQQRAVEIFVRLHPGDQVEVYDLLGDDVSNLLLQQLFGISNRLGADWQHACSGNRGYNYTVGIECFGSRPCALASSVLVTAITDSFGFFIFLSLASFFLNNLL